MLVAFGERDNRPFTKNREVGGPAPYSFGVVSNKLACLNTFMSVLSCSGKKA